jgi:hypothetical protein
VTTDRRQALHRQRFRYQLFCYYTGCTDVGFRVDANNDQAFPATILKWHARPDESSLLPQGHEEKFEMTNRQIFR